MSWKPRLATILLGVNLVILLLPLAGIGVLRLYENELIQRTESELIAQGVLIGAAYRQEVENVLDLSGWMINGYGQPVSSRWKSPENPAIIYHPIPPRLDIAIDPVLPAAPPAAASSEPDPVASRAADKIAPILLAAKDATLVGVRVVDFNGNVVASTGEEKGLSLHDREEVRRALEGEQVSLLRQRLSNEPMPSKQSISRGKRVRVFVALPVVSQGRVLGAVILSRTPLDIGKALFMIRYHLLIIAGTLLVAVIVVTAFTSLAIRKPLLALIRQADRVAKGEKGAAVPLAKPGIHEIDQLSHALAGMAKTLEERADYIRAFATSVSHEFKTPLASIRGSIELLQDHLSVMSVEERERFLQNISKDAERLDRLVRGLLDLAKADVSTPGEETARIKEILERLARQYPEKGMAVKLRVAANDLSVKMSPETFESVMVNLLDNTWHHGGAGVEVIVDVRAAEEESPQVAILEIIDNGPGISEGNRDKIFRPFFTTARERGGSGLGLSIVQSLILAHGGEISLEPSEHGARFCMRIPKA